MWVDKLKAKYLEEEVEVVRVIESPATPDRVCLTFPDGSHLEVIARANIPEDVPSELKAIEIADTQSAMKWLGNIVRELYANAIEKHTDVDFW
jgi:hypothetical protein